MHRYYRLRWTTVFSFLLFLAIATQAAEAGKQDEFAAAMATIEQQAGGTIGVYALDTASGNSLRYREDERFAMASTFKPLLVAMVLAAVDRGELDLQQPVSLAEVDVQPYSPVINESGPGESLTLAELCDAAVTLGDNTATNLLLDAIGGPAALTRFLRRHGDNETRLDRYEVELNTNKRGDARDTTTPRAMVGSLQRMLLSDVLEAGSKQRLQDWMVSSTTGGARLRAGLPGAWRIGDKTGTGMNGAVNNVAIAWPPESEPLLIAVYMSWSDSSVATLSDVHADIAKRVAAALPRAIRRAGQ